MNAIITIWQRIPEQVQWALQGAGIAALIISAMALVMSINPKHKVILDATAWTCTAASVSGVDAICTAYGRSGLK